MRALLPKAAREVERDHVPELGDHETSDEFLAWLGTKVKGRVAFLDDGTPHVHWKLTDSFIYWVTLYRVTLADGTTFDDIMEELAGPLVAAAQRRRDGK